MSTEILSTAQPNKKSLEMVYGLACNRWMARQWLDVIENCAIHNRRRCSRQCATEEPVTNSVANKPRQVNAREYVFKKTKTKHKQTKTPFTRYNRLSKRLYKGFDNRLYRVNKHPTGCQTGCQTGLTTGLTTGCIHDTAVLSNRLSNGFDNRFNVCIHDTAGCQTGCKPVWQPAVSCIQTFNRLSNLFDDRFNNRLDVCLHDTAGCIVQTG